MCTWKQNPAEIRGVSPGGGGTGGCDQWRCWELNLSSLYSGWVWLQTSTFSRTSLPPGIWNTPNPITLTLFNTESNIHSISHFGGKMLNWIQSASWAPLLLLHSKPRLNSLSIVEARNPFVKLLTHNKILPFLLKGSTAFYPPERGHPCSDTA